MRGYYRMTVGINGYDEPISTDVPILAFAGNGVLVCGENRLLAPCNNIINVQVEVVPNTLFS